MFKKVDQPTFDSTQLEDKLEPIEDEGKEKGRRYFVNWNGIENVYRKSVWSSRWPDNLNA